MKLFISYSHQDTEFVEKLIYDLEFATELSVSIDKRCIRGGDSLTNIFNEIGESDFLLLVLSESYLCSEWCKKEFKVAIVKEIETIEFKVIPIATTKRWEELKTVAPHFVKEALRDKHVIDFSSSDYNEAFLELVAALAPETTPREMYSQIADPEGENPFRRVRAEHFREPTVFAKLFAEPEIAHDALVSPKPALLEGSRGSGKTMILKSLRASIAPLIKGKRSFTEARLPYFGVYIRTSRDAFSLLQDDADMVRGPAKIGMFYDELILKLGQSVIEELRSCIQSKILRIDNKTERLIAKTLLECLRINENAVDLEAASKIISEKFCLILDYVRASSRGEDVSYNLRSLAKNNLVQFCRRLSEYLPELQDSYVCFLIDEYENLRRFQKVVLNTLIKWHQADAFTFKVATKKTGFNTPQTLEKQELEEGHDYQVVNLDFETSDLKDGRYEQYLARICRKIMEVEGFQRKEIAAVLEDRSVTVPRELGRYKRPRASEIKSEVIRMLSIRRRDWKSLTPLQQKRARDHLYIAAEFRLLGPRRRAYGGFHDLKVLSSGIVRVFLELCGMAYYLARQDGQKVKQGDKIKVKHQTEAANYLSEYYLWRINKNIEYLGEVLHSFTVDIGDIFRQKLLKHLSEPEAARLEIHEPQRLRKLSITIKDEIGKKEYTLKQILDISVLHSIFQEYGKRGGARGKQVYISQPHHYTLNRIFAPALQISPSSRWSVKIMPEELKGLLDGNQRSRTKRVMIRKVTKEVKTLLDFLG